MKRGMARDPISEIGYFDPSRGDGESAFAQPKDTQFGRSRQGTWRPHERSTDILRAKRGKNAHSLRGNPYSLDLPKSWVNSASRGTSERQFPRMVELLASSVWAFVTVRRA